MRVPRRGDNALLIKRRAAALPVLAPFCEKGTDPEPAEAAADCLLAINTRRSLARLLGPHGRRDAIRGRYRNRRPQRGRLIRHDPPGPVLALPL